MSTNFKFGTYEIDQSSSDFFLVFTVFLHLLILLSLRVKALNYWNFKIFFYLEITRK